VNKGTHTATARPVATNWLQRMLCLKCQVLCLITARQPSAAHVAAAARGEVACGKRGGVQAHVTERVRAPYSLRVCSLGACVCCRERQQAVFSTVREARSKVLQSGTDEPSFYITNTEARTIGCKRPVRRSTSVTPLIRRSLQHEIPLQGIT